MRSSPHSSVAESPVKTQSAVSVLLVDDDSTKRFALKTILAPLGENIVEAASGADALRQLLRQEFAVVLLDVRMPVMDGFETAQLIRQRPRSV
jgi:CheY-like chemotaxis protein